MPRPPRAAMSTVTVAAALLSLLLASGCSRRPPQSVEHTVITGVNAQVGSILIRDATVRQSGSGEAVLDVALYNTATTGSDTLQSVASTQASQAELPDASSLSSPGLAATPVDTPTVQPSQQSVASSAAPAVSSSSGSSSGSSSTASSGGVEIPAEQAVFLNHAPAEITLTGFTSPLRVGTVIPVTLRFASAGSIVLQVPVVSNDLGSEVGPSVTGTPATSPTYKATESAKPTNSTTDTTGPAPSDSAVVPDTASPSSG